MRRLSDLADACVGAAVDFLLRDAHAQGKLALPDPDDPGQGLRVDRARHGQARRAGAQFLLRHRPDPVLRCRRAGDRGSARRHRAVFAAGAAAGAHPAGPHRRGLCLPHRSAAAARSRARRRSPSRSCRAALLRGQGTELGARRHDQGAARGRRHRRGGSLPRRAAALCLAQIHGLCGDRRRPFDQAPDPCAQGPWRDRGQGPQRQARPRRHPRDRVLRPDPAADRRRPLPATCAAARPCRCWRRWPRMAGSPPRPATR